jgi:hypothetical protein
VSTKRKERVPQHHPTFCETLGRGLGVLFSHLVTGCETLGFQTSDISPSETSPRLTRGPLFVQAQQGALDHKRERQEKQAEARRKKDEEREAQEKKLVRKQNVPGVLDIF